MRVLFATAVFALGAAVVAAQEKKEPPVEDKKPVEKQPAKPPDPAEPPVADNRFTGPPVIDGVYTVAAVERDGRSASLDGYKDAIVRIVNGRIVGTDRDRREFIVATCTVNTEKKPWALDMIMLTERKDSVKGLAKKDNHILTLIHSLPGGDAPTEFKTKRGQQMFVLRGFVLDPLTLPNKFSHSP